MEEGTDEHSNVVLVKNHVTLDHTWPLMGVYIHHSLKVACHFLSGSTIEALDCFFPLRLVHMQIL